MDRTQHVLTATLRSNPHYELVAFDRLLPSEQALLGPLTADADFYGVLRPRGSDGATTVAAALHLAHRAGVDVFATGGIGGVHREPPFDESADLLELARTTMVVVCAGAKAILDLAATLERLESLGVTVVGYRTDELPGFFTVGTGHSLAARADESSQFDENTGLLIGRLYV